MYTSSQLLDEHDVLETWTPPLSPRTGEAEPVDTTVDGLCEEMAKLSIQAAEPLQGAGLTDTTAVIPQSLEQSRA